MFGTKGIGSYNIGRTTGHSILMNVQNSQVNQDREILFFAGTYASSGAVSMLVYMGKWHDDPLGNPIQYASVNSYWTEHFYAYGQIKLRRKL